jgi:hypothetical protein
VTDTDPEPPGDHADGDPTAFDPADADDVVVGTDPTDRAAAEHRARRLEELQRAPQQETGGDVSPTG